MSTGEIAALIVSVVAVAIGIMAIWLSIIFYRMSTQLSESTKEAAKGIGASVERLEKLFDRLYSDTFSMVRDTVSDMRKHAWPEETRASSKLDETEKKKADEKVEALKTEIYTSISEILEKQKMTDGKVTHISAELRHLVDRAINESRKAESEARDETLRQTILQELRSLAKLGERFEADALVRRLIEKLPEGQMRQTIPELSRLREEGIISWEGNLRPHTTVVIGKLP